MTEIEKLIEEEAEKLQYGMQVESFKKGANFILHHNRWRKVSKELPEVDKTLEPITTYQTTKTFRNLACKDAQGRLYIKDRISIDNGVTWNWLFEDKWFEVTEWKPID